MQATSTDAQPPFWVDDPFPYPRVSSGKLSLIQKMVVVIAGLVRILELFMVFGLLAVFVQQVLGGWVCIVILALVFVAISFGLPLANRRRVQDAVARAKRAQQLAQERTGAELMGSALHTAGHPLLQKNQPVVLGLRGDELSIYGYSNSEPIDVINARDIRGVHTITLDEDLFAHTDVVDSTAQAFQLRVSARGMDYICSFRRPYKVRAIEWYRALEAARLAGGGKSIA